MPDLDKVRLFVGRGVAEASAVATIEIANRYHSPAPPIIMLDNWMV